MDKWYNVNKLHIMKKMKWICWLIPGKREKNHLFITSERVIMKGEKMEKIKELKDPDLVDRFLFAEVMEDEGSLADVLEIILGREVPGLRLEDGATRIFLNTRGIETTGVSQELIDLLHYFEKTTDSNAAASSSDKIRRLHEKVSRIKDSEEIGIKFMNEWEEKMLERKEGREEGERTKQREIAEKMLLKGMEPVLISEITGLSEDEVRELKNAAR